MGLLETLKRLSQPSAKGLRLQVGTMVALIAVFAALWFLTWAVSLLGVSGPTIVVEGYKQLWSKFLPGEPSMVPLVLGVPLLGCTILFVKKSWRDAAGEWAFPVVLRVLEVTVAAGEVCERRRRMALGLWTCGLAGTALSGFAMFKTISNANAEAARFRTWLVETERFVRSTTIDPKDIVAFRKLPIFEPAFDVLAPPGLRGPMAARLLDTTLKTVFRDSLALNRARIVALAHKAALELGNEPRRKTNEAAFDELDGHAWSLVLLLRARLAIDILENCSTGCPDHGDVLQDLQAVGRDTFLVREATNARGRALTWAISRSLGHGVAPADTVIKRCRADLWACVNDAMRAYDGAALLSDESCTIPRLRAQNNQLDLLARLASAHDRIVGVPTVKAVVPAWVVAPRTFGDSLDERSEQLMACVSKTKDVPPPLYLTVAEAAAARFGIQFQGSEAPHQEVENVASLIRLSFAVVAEAPDKLRPRAFCGLNRSPSGRSVWEAAKNTLRPLPNWRVSLLLLQKRVREACT